jgi:hypothetical protein
MTLKGTLVSGTYDPQITEQQALAMYMLLTNYHTYTKVMQTDGTWANRPAFDDPTPGKPNRDIYDNISKAVYESVVSTVLTGRKNDHSKVLQAFQQAFLEVSSNAQVSAARAVGIVLDGGGYPDDPDACPDNNTGYASLIGGLSPNPAN